MAARRKNAAQANGPHSAPHTPPVPPPVPSADPPAAAVWAALTASPGATTAQIADSAGTSRIAAGRELAALETSGLATRTPGARTGRTTAPATWQPAPQSAPPGAGHSRSLRRADHRHHRGRTPAAPTRLPPRCPLGQPGRAPHPQNRWLDRGAGQRMITLNPSQGPGRGAGPAPGQAGNAWTLHPPARSRWALAGDVQLDAAARSARRQVIQVAVVHRVSGG